jgi:sorting nexin-8
VKIQPVIEQWNRICFLGDRLVRRREGAAADYSRLSITLRALNEVNSACWRGDACELCGGVREGLERVSGHMQTASDITERRVRFRLGRLSISPLVASCK